jgi:hypothetical protein
MVGTGFLLEATANWAIVVTAKHVLLEGVSNAQNPDFRHAPSAFFLPDNYNAPLLDPKRLRAIWRGRDKGEVLALNIFQTSHNEAHDLAVCVVAPQLGDEGKITPISVVMDVTTPKIGDQIFMASTDEMSVVETCAPSGPGNQYQSMQISRRTNIRTGVVTGRYLAGYRQYKWPCFTTSIPAKGGMSGGLVGRWRPNQTVTACGVVCADNSTEESHCSYLECGESVIGCLWPALALNVPDRIPPPSGERQKTIYQKIVSGHFTGALNIESVAVNSLETGGCQIHYRDTI